ncbi:DivIVA domain-containing protein [Arthrobacter zhangbolii]|uniref:Cell wall synthesis protein Wag31 n=1 Tax=Arthrobacter zhangbolii TaxID=2886936 RepID=A0A9X1M6Q7_9MICC|nr:MULTISPECIES: DivIVA domain-containing protein [Arthrobacter]MCC3271895.1 DivIVA domain-containing protein [Arthrobacter zhangbolii]MCC3293801.1 DivIVA domain-containing protein [Arthrobacter zhangbolii]MDN3904971.1 DivIVA domain-containing protein [Arthrobacter sp. YD2]UON93286.1 DivIVA domain-containing protein [Arthrobacter zhangbolii]
MALTPEDVVNKRFQPTKFREGYDQDEVDDFLDEIVVELRRLNAENEDLRRQLAEAVAGGSSSSVPAPVAAASKTEQVAEEPKPEPKVEAPKAEEKPAPVETKPEPAPAPAAAPAAANNTETAAGILAMAQKMHDDYVSAGVEQRDKIIAEAQIEASGLVTDAQEKSRKILSTLEQQKAVLERKVEQLRGFERDYRSRLKAYIEGQLRDLDARGSVASETADA